MDQYSNAEEIRLLDTDVFLGSYDDTQLMAYVTEQGHLEIKVLRDGKQVRQLTYRGKFLVEWGVKR